jgi:hypothetical protein
VPAIRLLVGDLVEGRTFSIERTYPVPPAEVFAAFASEEARTAWGADGIEIPADAEPPEFDFRAGGREVPDSSNLGVPTTVSTMTEAPRIMPCVAPTAMTSNAFVSVVVWADVTPAAANTTATAASTNRATARDIDPPRDLKRPLLLARTIAAHQPTDRLRPTSTIVHWHNSCRAVCCGREKT